MVDLGAIGDPGAQEPTSAESAGVPRMHDNAVPRSVQNYVLAHWTTSEHADWCMNMRAGDALYSACASVSSDRLHRAAWTVMRQGWPSHAGRLG